MSEDNVYPIQKKLDQVKVVRELDNYVSKSFDMSQYGEGGGSSVWQEEIKAWMDGHLLKSLFFSEDWVFILTDLVANKISSQPLRVMQRTSEGGKEVAVVDTEHPLNDLLRQPNPWQDYASFMYNWVTEHTLMGNGVVWHAPKAGHLVVLASENLTLDFDHRGNLKEYLLANFADGEVQTPDGIQRFKEKEIIHTRRPNPNSLLWGLSPFIPGRKSILFNRYSTDYLNAFYLKQATPGLALSLDRMVNEDVALRQLRSFEVAYQGRKNSRRTLVLPKGVTATPLTHSLSDQKLLDHIQVNRETIMGLLKVPPHEVGLNTSASLGSEEYKTAIRNFWEATLKPTMDMIAGSLTKQFQAELGGNGFFQFDLSDVEALRDDLSIKATTAKAMLEAGLSINEVRAEVWEKDAIQDESADIPYNLVTVRSSALSQFSAPVADKSEEVEDTKAIKKIRLSSKVENFRRLSLKQLTDEESRKIGKLSELAIDLLVGMTATAIEVVLDSVTQDSKALVTKADKLPSKKVLERRIKRALEEQWEESWSNDVAKTLETSVDLGFDQQLDLVINAQARQEVATLKERDKEGRRLTLEARGLESFAQISATHTERIMKQITEGQKKGEAIGTIMRRVAEELGTPGELAGRAETIARTETLTAVSIGQAAALDNASEVIPGLKKSWLTAGDNRVRDSHSAIDGDVIDVNEKFDNGLRHPRDVKFGDAADNINCRCTILLVAPDDEDILGV